MATAESKLDEPAKGDDIQMVEHRDDQVHGRAIQQQEHNRTWGQTLRKDPRLLFWIGVMLWTLIVRGFESGASGALISIPVFRRRFGVLIEGTYFISTKWQSVISGAPNGAAIVGAWGASFLADRYGSKPIILLAAVINIVSVGIEFGATSLAMFFVGKMFNFLAIGALLNLCTAYIADVAPLAIRASAIGFCNLLQCIGPFIAAIMSNYTAKWDTDWSWKALVAAQWGFAAVALVGQIFMPESPVYLVRMGKMTAAQKSLERMYSDPQDAKGHLHRISLTLEEAELSNTGSYIDCFRGTNLRRTLICIMVFLSEPMAGLGFVGSYGALMYQYLGISDQKSFEIRIGAEVLSMSGATIAFLMADWWGRRPMYLLGCISICILMLCMAISGSFDTTAAITASVGFYTMFNFWYNVGVGSTVYALAGELPTSVLRAKTLAISISTSNSINTFFAFISPFMFNPDYGNLKAKIGFVFGAFMFIFAILAYFFVPETRRRTYEELDELFMKKVPTRQFRKYVTVAEQRAAEAYAVQEKIAPDLKV
ncbi:General alpha-glucoside permease like protein [Verticillium longisporum]|uniref:General alpha-glucoside permease like protein n=1 Tax=Verticillium longisporum TaxID=100787 RepID=A0A8I3AMJ7_VERLO|nr:General alpha-glucoside permease like protein [Verticillium longisporum]